MVRKCTSILFAVVAIFLQSCASVVDAPINEGVNQVSGNVYEIFKTDYRGIFGGEESLKSEVIASADSFAKDNGKIALPITAKIHRVGILGDWAWFYYKFAIVEKSHELAKNTTSEIQVERDARLAKEFYIQRHQDSRSNIYDQLGKLNDLRKAGAMTDAEFEREKLKLLK